MVPQKPKKNLTHDKLDSFSQQEQQVFNKNQIEEKKNP